MNVVGLLLPLNIHGVADAGLAISAASAALHTNPAAQALIDLFGPEAARKIEAVTVLTGLIGAGLAYLGRPRTVDGGK